MLRTLAQVLLAVLCCTYALPAQTALRVLRYAPTDTASAGSIISVTFNRPVAGMLDETIVASDVMTIEPSVKGRFEWRDPITLRFLPQEPLPPASTFVVSVDTAAISSVGKRRAATGRRASQFQFTIRVPGPKRLLAYANDQSVGDGVPVLGPVSSFGVLYSSTVDLEAFTQLSRLEFPPECGGTIPLRTTGTRDVGANAQSFREWTDVDPESVQFYRWVDMAPRDSLRPGCKGTWIVPLFNDPGGRTTDRHAVRTSPEFKIDSVESCIRNRADPKTPCDPNGIIVWFSAPVSPQALGRHVSVSPGLGQPAGTRGWTSTVVFSQRLVPRQKYTVSVDSAIRDIYGRKLQGARSISVLARDRLPGMIHQSHLVTLSRSSPVLKLRTVNVDTIAMFVNAIPDTLLSTVLGRGFAGRVMTDNVTLGSSAARVISIPVNGKFNEEQEVSVTLPQLARTSASPLTAVRFEMKTRSIASDSTTIFAARSADSIRHAAEAKSPPARNGLLSFPLLAQVSDLRAHSKIQGDVGVVFVTDVNGRPVGKASVSLFDEYGRLRASSTTNQDGLATLTTARRTHQPTASPPLTGRYRTRYLEVMHGRERLVTSVESAVGNTLEAALGPWSLAERVRPGDYGHGTIFTDRDIYRPGETVHLKAYVRTGVVGSIVVPPPDSFRVSIRALDSDNYIDDDERSQTSMINEYGAASDSVRLPPNTKLGRYLLSAEVRDDDDWWDLGSTEIRVAEFRAPDFVVDLKPDTAVRYAGDSVRVGVAGRYLFGVPMRIARVEWTASVTRSDQPAIAIPNTRGYRIGAQRWWEDNANQEASYSHGTDSLDENGNAHIALGTTASAASGAAQAKIDVGITDVNNQTVTRTVFVKLHPASVSVAAKPRGDASVWKTGVEQTIDVLVVRNSGERLSGVPVAATIVRRRWVTDTGSSSGAPRWVADTVQRLAVTSSRDSVALRFTPASDGAYDVRLEARDENGRVARTNFGQWAYANPWTSTYATNPAKLNVSVRQHGRTDFSLGDTAHVSFESPFERAQAWITLEREGVVEQRSMAVGRGNTTLPIPITARFAPNIWVGVLLVNQPSQPAASANSADEVLRAGYAQLAVDSTAHMLSVTVQPLQSQLLPGDSARMRVSVRDVSERPDGKGVSSEVALWAVDEGVLSLTGYRTPNILRLIDERLGFSSLLNSTLTELAWRNTQGIVLPGIAYRSRGGAEGGRVGGVQLQSALTSDGPANDAPVSRSEFRLTAFFVGSTVTDSNGVAIITGKLPDNITTFRIMATAVTKGERYGSGEAPLLVTRRVVVRPSLPRFVRLGDSVTFGVALSVRDSANALLTVKGSATSGPFIGDSTQQVRLTGGQSNRAPFSLAIPERTTEDSLVVKLSATDNAIGDGDAITTVLPIRPAGTPRAHTVTGMVRGSASATMLLPGNIDQSRSTVAVNLGTSPLVAMRTFYERLRDYSYYNTELLTTSARALLALYRAERAMNEVAPARDSATVARELQRAVDEIVAREVEEGLFANWPRTQQPEDGWFSAYVGTFLLDAEREGIKVPDELLNRIADKLKELVKSRSWQADTLTVQAAERRNIKRLRFSERLVALRFLRAHHAPEIIVEDSLIASANELSWEDRVGVVELLAERDDDEERALVMLNKLWTAVSAAGKRIDIADSLRGSGSFPSRIRPAARLFKATSELLPEHPMLGALAETIIQHGSVQRNWAWNSLDYAAAIEALGDHASAQRGAVGERVTARGMDGRVLFDRSRMLAATQQMSAVDSVHSMRGLIRSTRSDSAIFTISMQVSNDSVSAPASRATAPLYYSVTVNEIPLTRPVTPDVAGFTVERWYERLDSGAPVTSVNEGEVVRVRLRLTVPADRQYVTLEDLLPAGLEVVDLSLNTSATVGPFAKRSTTSRRSISRDEAQADRESQFAGGWWSPWEYKESRDDRVFYFARQLWSGSYYVSYLARATTAGTFVKPPAHAEEMYNKALQGRSDGGVFVVKPAKK